MAAGNFNPPPKVQSAVIRLTRRYDREPLIGNHSQLQAVVKQAFNQRRKKLSNALSGFSFDETKLPVGILDRRAEQLSVEEFIGLSNAVTTTILDNSMPDE